MITKERLEELIKQGATVYVPDNVWQTIDEIHLERKCYISENGKLCNDKITYEDLPNATAMYSIPLEDLFETEEDAEFALKYKRIPRTEYLDLPTWEEFCELDDMFIFYYNEKEYCVDITNDETLESECIEITCHDIDAFGECYSYSIFIEEATKENYIKACRLVKKLFLGEEV